ncbi:MAG: hypothetical protein VW146_05815 [Gammaproteobacteria bacterium]
MKKLFLSIFMVSATLVFAAHHEESQPVKASNFAVLSSYTIAAGTNPEKLQKELLAYIAEEEARGFNACGLLRHQFGGDRAFYTYCLFEDYNHLAEIMDNTSANANEKQTYSTHTDNIVAFNHRNLTKQTKYTLFVTSTFGPYLTFGERRERAETFFGFYEAAFGGCNMMEHAWGTAPAFYFVCGFDSYAEFADAGNRIGTIFAELDATKLDLLDHSDDIMIRVER